MQENVPECQPDDTDIEPDGPVLHIPNISSDTTFHLP